MRVALPIGVCALALASSPSPAEAYWQAGGSGVGSAAAAVVPAADRPTVSVSGRSVTVSWPQTSVHGRALGSYDRGGYMLKRYVQGVSTTATPAVCSTPITGAGATLECTEADVPAGDWQYSVTPMLGSFTGGESPKSAAVAVTATAPTLSFSSPTTITILPTTLLGG